MFQNNLELFNISFYLLQIISYFQFDKILIFPAHTHVKKDTIEKEKLYTFLRILLYDFFLLIETLCALLYVPCSTGFGVFFVLVFHSFTVCLLSLFLLLLSLIL